jgi:two-component system sensor histidine kinase YesM
MIQRFLQFSANLSLRKKYFIAFLLLILLPLMLFIAINNYFSARDAEKQVLDNSRLVFDQGKSFLEYKLGLINNNMNTFSLDNAMQQILKKDSRFYAEDIWTWIVDYKTFDNMFLNLQSNTDITGVHVFMYDSIPAIYQTKEILKIKPVENLQWYKKTMANSNGVTWFNSTYFPDPPNADNIYAVRKIYDNADLRTFIGILKVDIPQYILTNILNKISYIPSSSTLLINSNNEVLGSSNHTNQDLAMITDALKLYTPDDLNNGKWIKVRNKDQYVMMGIQTITGADWKLVLTIPYKEILALNAKVTYRAILITLLASLFALPLAYLAAASLTKRIRKLIKEMKKVVTGNLNIGKLSESNDEIGILIRNFNAMLNNINELLDEKYYLGKQVKNVELKALQAQINPHFLYNTLELINWKAFHAQNDEISSLVQSLSTFYKLSLGNGKDIVPLMSEIEHIKAYVEVQNMRFENSILLKIDIPEELYAFKIPKILLQPLVENAINHGIREKDTETGTVLVKGKLVEKTFMLEVSDDGIGMSREKIVEIFTSTSHEDIKGYGVWNINERIKLHYGPQYGLSCESKLDHGTTVRMTLPYE